MIGVEREATVATKRPVHPPAEHIFLNLSLGTDIVNVAQMNGEMGKAQIHALANIKGILSSRPPVAGQRDLYRFGRNRTPSSSDQVIDAVVVPIRPVVGKGPLAPNTTLEIVPYPQENLDL